MQSDASVGRCEKKRVLTMQKSGPVTCHKNAESKAGRCSQVQAFKISNWEKNFHGLECLTPTTESDKGDSKDSIVDTGR